MKKIKIAFLRKENKNILSKMAFLTTCNGPKEFYHELVILLSKDFYDGIESAEIYKNKLILPEDSTNINLNDFWIERTGKEVETAPDINRISIKF